MIEKVNPSHPDKVADRIAGAIVDLAYTKRKDPKIAVEILIGHGTCNIIIETDTEIKKEEAEKIVERISGEKLKLNFLITKQDEYLSKNQEEKIKCGDNGIFKGVPVSDEEKKLSKIVREIYKEVPHDGKYILDGDKLIMCQSNIDTEKLKERYPKAIVNPLGNWSGGINVDTGATNRKLGSDMGRAVTGGGLHGKDLSKCDVSVNIYAHLKAQKENREINLSCAIGDETVDGLEYEKIVEIARKYINELGGFEKLAEWGIF